MARLPSTITSMSPVLDEFCDDLKKLPWGGTEWKNARKKRDAIVKNC